MKKSGTIRKKRVTLRALLLRALALVLALTAAFSLGIQAWIKSYIDGECWEWAETCAGGFQRQIRDLEYEYAAEGPEQLMQIIRWKLAQSGNTFSVVMPDRKDDLFQKQGISPNVYPECQSCIVLADGAGNIVATDRTLFSMVLVFRDDDPKLQTPISSVNTLKRLYLCDPEQLKPAELPELDAFFQTYRRLSQPTADSVNAAEVKLTSIYVNRAEHSFIPHRAIIKNYTKKRSNLQSDYDYYHITEEEIAIDVDLPGYELVTVHEGVRGFEVNVDDETGEAVLADREQYLSKVEYPHALFGTEFDCSFGGSEAALAEFERDQSFSAPLNENDRYNASISRRYHRLEDGRAVFLVNGGVEIGGEWYSLHVRCMLDYRNELVVRYCGKWIALFAGALTLLALAWCLWKNYRNKLRYAMEDAQRSLTDKLARDVSAPLAAIGDSTRKLLGGELSATEQTAHLNAILDEIADTDALVSRTLQLNHMGEARQPKPERIALEKLAAELLQKYEPLLGEKQITHSIDGSAAVQADPAAMETILENLIANAADTRRITAVSGSK